MILRKIFLIAVFLLSTTHTVSSADTSLLLLESRARIAQEKYFESVELLKEILTQDPINTAVYNNLALSFLGLGEYRMALETILRAEKLDENSVEISYTAGLIFAFLEDYQKAADYFSKVVFKDKDFAEGYFNLGVCYFHLNDNQKAMEYFKQFMNHHPGRETIKFLPNVHEIEQGQYSQEIVACENRIKREPKDYLNYASLGVQYGWLKKYDESLRFLYQASVASPESALIYFNLGSTLKRLAKDDAARVMYAKAAQLSPKYGFGLDPKLNPSGAYAPPANCLHRSFSPLQYAGFADVYYYMGRIYCQVNDAQSVEKMKEKLIEIGRYDLNESLAACTD